MGSSGNAGLLVRNDILEMAMRLLSDSSRDLYLNYAERWPAYLRRCIDTYMPVPYGSLSPSASRAEFLSWHLLNDGDAPLWTAVRTAVSALSWQRGRQTFSRHAECNVTFGAFGRGPYVGLCSLTAQHGSLCRLMNRLINHLKPDHIWSSISISKNMLTPPHRDQQNHASDTLLVGHLILTRAVFGLRAKVAVTLKTLHMDYEGAFDIASLCRRCSSQLIVIFTAPTGGALPTVSR